jgi:TetR/AcrR family transcriptional repressor of nem operon
MPIIHSERKAQILDIAQELVQTRGFNAFSFGHLAERIGVKPPAIHHHYPTKNELGLALMQRYRNRLHASLANIDRQQQAPRKKLERYIMLFQATLRPDHRMCLCGMLATELPTLSAELQGEVRTFFEDNEAWLARVLGEGRKTRTLEFEGTPAGAARIIYAMLQGAMISARTFSDANRLVLSGRWLLDVIVPPMMDALLPPPE